jgi:hypothetical protein
MGIHGDFGNERVAAAYRTMIAAAREHGKFPGMAGVYNETLMPRYIEMGARFIPVRPGRGVHGGRRSPAHRVPSETLAGLAIRRRLAAVALCPSALRWDFLVTLMRACFTSLPSRRRLLALSAGLTAAAWLPVAGKEATASSRLIVRPIPHSGESLPSVGLRTSQVFDVGDDPDRRRACTEVIRTLVAGGGKLIDTAPSYGTAESVVCDLIAAARLRDRAFLATKREDYDRNTGAAQLRASLQRLRTERVDLMQLHMSVIRTRI